jgi:hypothetical protein
MFRESWRFKCFDVTFDGDGRYDRDGLKLLAGKAGASPFFSLFRFNMLMELF